jgi:outer membrane protein TolC
MNNSYDRDKALWDGKFKFLEQQRDTAKKDFEDAQRKFQATVEQLQKTQNESKSKSKTTHTMMMSQLE